MLAPWKKGYDQPRQHIIKQRHYFADKCPSSQSYGFSSSHVWMWELDHKESWALRIDAFELWHWRLLRVSCTARWSNQSILKKWVLNIHWNDLCWSWNTNTLATWCKELTYLKWPWCWERVKAGGEGMTEDEMVGWHHWLNGHEFEWTLGVGDGQRSLGCCSSWGRKELDTSEQLNWTPDLVIIAT